ncbi:cellulose binding domain-containing protein [Catenulispora yoronensis]|uniref:Cellulose binding domain-containing protein n=1 Tax=Catenulispora yoronensis TaxID=450799 RepID=A0ABN2UHH1_9ACTN
MAVPKRVRVLGTSVATAAVVGAGAVAAFTAGAAGSSTGTVTASFAKTTDWGSGFQAEYTITNGTGRIVHGWTVSFALPAGERISSLWNGTMTVSGQQVTVANPQWDGDIGAGTSVAFGFVVDASGGSGAPENCVINGALCSSGSRDDGPTAAVGATASTDPSAPGDPSSPASSSDASSPLTAQSLTVPQPDADALYKFAPYVDTGQRQDLGAVASAAGVKAVTAAFVLSGNGCAPVWNGSADVTFDSDLKAGLADLRAEGGDAIASFGGANGVDLAQACTDVASLEAAYKAVIDEYGFTHVDFDIEGAAGSDKSSIARRSQALARLQREYAAAGKTLEVSLTLPVLPDGLTPEGVAVVTDAARNGVAVSVVNVLAMDYGDWAAPSPAGKMGRFADEAAQSLHDQLKKIYSDATDAQLWAMVGITPMIGANDTADEVFQVADAQVVEEFAALHHIGRLGMWSLTRDKVCAGASAWATPTCSSIQQGPYDFSHTFGAFVG